MVLSKYKADHTECIIRSNPITVKMPVNIEENHSLKRKELVVVSYLPDARLKP